MEITATLPSASPVSFGGRDCGQVLDATADSCWGQQRAIPSYNQQAAWMSGAMFTAAPTVHIRGTGTQRCTDRHDMRSFWKPSPPGQRVIEAERAARGRYRHASPNPVLAGAPLSAPWPLRIGTERWCEACEGLSMGEREHGHGEGSRMYLMGCGVSRPGVGRSLQPRSGRASLAIAS